MDKNDQRTSHSVGSILQVTKSIIQGNENFYDYYINRDNSLYHKQLPLLIRKTKLQALVIRNKENKKLNENYSMSLHKGNALYDDIRNAQIRSKKLPPLCPFYNEKGELVPSVVKTSRIYNSYNFDNDNNITFTSRKNKKILKKIKKINYFDESTKTDFDQIENDYFNFNDINYDKLHYREKMIFGKKEYYLNNVINKYIDEFKNKEQLSNDNKESKKEKIFDKNRKKKHILLSLESICVQIFDTNNNNDTNENNEVENNKNQINPLFEYYLPFEFLPLFYYKGEEKFKIFLSKIILWDNVNKKFILNENQEKIFQDILKNCSDFSNKLKADGKKFEKLKSEEQIKQNRTKFYSSTGTKKTFLKKDTHVVRQLPSSGIINQEQSFAQTMSAQIPNTYITNSLENSTRYNVSYRKSLYPSEKEVNYMNYNVFEFLWITPNKIFKVLIKLPLITVQIPKNSICVKKYVDFDLLFFLYENNFQYWDFYVAKYLTSFKDFRTLLEDINSINESFNKKFYLINPKVKSYSFNNYKMVNIVTIKHSDILENLIDGLMNNPDDKKENKVKQNAINEKVDNNVNPDNKNEIKNEQKEETIQYKKDEEKLQNSTFIMKSFIAIIRFVDIKTLKAEEFKIYFNFEQFHKFQKLEKFIDKISFLIKFIDINYIHKKVIMNYKALDNFNENEWIKDFKKYNIQYLNTIKNSIQKESPRTFTEFSGMSKNTSIQIEILSPISLIRTLNENGVIKTEKNNLGYDNTEKTINVGKDDIKGLSRIFYDNYEEERDKNLNVNANANN